MFGLLVCTLVVSCLPLCSLADEWAVQLEPGVHPLSWAEQHHVTWVQTLEFLPDFYIFATAPGSPRRLRDLRDVQWAEVQTTRPRRFPRVAIPDPLWDSQWHLHNHPCAVDADRMGNLTGAGVTIAIVDDGLQHAHPDLRANYDRAHSWDFNDQDADPTPVGDHAGHGTSAAGVAAAAANNGHCGRGAAPGAKLVGLRTIAEGVTDAVEAQALSHNGIGIVDIYSSSWGPIDDGESLEGPGYVVQSALAAYTSALRGRLGKGTIYLWASGNGAAKGDSCAYDGYASSPFVFAIGALNHLGNQSAYSEGCASLMAVTPSSGAGRGITTADLMGEAGYSPDECTLTFGGTSAATPLAAGLVALLLEAQPKLSWRDVQHIMAKGALRIHPEDPDWNVNAAGYHHSHRYGFGMLHGPSLLRTLAGHTLLTNRSQALWRSGNQNPEDLWIHDNTTIVYNVTGVTNMVMLERVTLAISLNTLNRGSLSIDLISPEGTVSHMVPPRPHDHTPYWPAGGWEFHSVRHFGERNINGAWRIVASDTDERTQGQSHFISFELIFRGAFQ